MRFSKNVIFSMVVGCVLCTSQAHAGWFTEAVKHIICTYFCCCCDPGGQIENSPRQEDYKTFEGINDDGTRMPQAEAERIRMMAGALTATGLIRPGDYDRLTGGLPQSYQEQRY